MFPNCIFEKTLVRSCYCSSVECFQSLDIFTKLHQVLGAVLENSSHSICGTATLNIAVKMLNRGQHISGDQSPDSNRGWHSSVPRQLMWVLCLRAVSVTRFSTKISLFPCQFSFHQCFIFIRIPSRGLTMGPLAAAVPRRHRLTQPRE